MKLVSALVGLAALGAVALSSATASAMPVSVPGQVSQASDVQQAAYVCNGWGHCWHQPNDGDGYYHPHYGGWGWHRGWGWHHWHRWHGGWGNGWHHWHHWNGGWGNGWHHWHHWNGGWGNGWHHWHHWNGGWGNGWHRWHQW
jgi:hypothetical protein